jgi:hypothetical protein
MSLTPVPSESAATCANCSAPLVADQRYCLACGHPCSPVRLAFLDVLQSERQAQAGPAGPIGTAPVVYSPPLEPAGGPAWLRRYSPLFAVLSVLLMAMIVGLLVGHWVTQSNAPAPKEQVLKVEGLNAGAAVAPTSTTPTTGTATNSAGTGASSEKAEAEETAKEAKAEKLQAAKVEHAKVSKPSSTKLQKIGSSTGKKHEEEVNSLGAQPIETGG